MSPPRAFGVLLVEDNPGDAYLVRELLEEVGDPVDLEHVSRLGEALERLSGGRPAGAAYDAVLLDLSLPDGHGLETVRRVRAAAPHTPIVVMSGLGDEAVALAAVQAGAQDYLVKGDVDGRLLARSLRYAVERARAAATLAQRNRELEERTAEAETFVYTVSHDLRQPLLSIRGMGELLSEAVSRGEGEEAGYLLERISRNVDKMGALLDDLLTLSRVGRVADEPRPLDLGEAAAAVLADLDVRLKERGAAVELPPSWPRVLMPRSEIEQVLANLVGNAVKFAGRPTPDGSGEPPRVRLTWSRAGRFVALRVSDNGPGVPAEFREKVFGLFQKLDPKSEGTGVGLAIVKRIAERHGGRAWVEASPLGGATVAVTLPIAES